MELPEVIHLFNLQINTFGIFLVVASFFSLFVFWQEGRKDGFDVEHLFDLFFISAIFSLLLSRVIFAVSGHYGWYGSFFHVTRFWTPGFNLWVLLFPFIAGTIFFAKRHNWSVFRILDITALALSFGFSIVCLGILALQKDFKLLFLFSFFLLVHAFLYFLRKKQYLSGLTFSAFLLLGGVLALLFLKNLPFALALFTISILNLGFRLRGSMKKIQTLPAQILEKFRKRLIQKDLLLRKQQQRLIREDPYMQLGRDIGNAEDMDEVVLEDTGHEIKAVQRSSLAKAMTQVRKALARFKIGKYGICEVCGQPIEQARLEIYPEATTCTSCNSKSDGPNS